MIILVIIVVLLVIVYGSIESQPVDIVSYEPKVSRINFSDDVLVRKFNKRTGKIIGDDNIVMINDKLGK